MDRVFKPILDDAGRSDAEPEPVAEDTGPAPEVVTADEPVPEGEEAPAAASVEEVDPYAEEIGPDSVSQDGKRFFYNKGKAETLMAAHKTIQGLRALDPNFSPDSYKEMLGRTIELDRMLTDLDSGDPQRVGAVAMDIVSANRNPASVSAFIDTAMAQVAQHHPQAFQTVQNKILAGMAQRFYNEYNQTRNEQTKKLAQNLDYLARKDFIDPDQNGAAADPLAAERASLAQREQAYNSRIQQDRLAAINAQVQSAVKSAESIVDSAIDSALSVIPQNVREMRAVDYRHAQRDLRDQFDTITKGSENFQKQYQILMQRLRTTPTDQSRDALVSWVKQWADYAVGRAKKEVVGRFTNSVTSSSNAAHAKQQEIAKRVEPSAGNNSPVQRASLQQKLKDPKVSYDEKFKMVFGE
jgi:hypothetical protein